MVDKQKEGCEVQKQYEKYGPTTTICNYVEKNFHEKDENPFLFVFDLEIDQKRPKNQATSVDLGKLREGSTPTAQLQAEGKKEKDLNKDKKEIGALNKDATSSPPLEKEQDEMTTEKERDRAFNRDVISSRSFEKKEEDLNAEKIGPKAWDEVAMSSPTFKKKKEDLNADKIGSKASDEVAMSSTSFERKEEDLNADKIGPKELDEVAMSSPSFEKKEEDLKADKIGPKASDEVAMSSPNVLEREEENLNTSKKSFKAANKNKFKDEKIERKRADGDPRQDLSPIMILEQFFKRIVSSEIGKVLLLLCFASLVIGKSEGNQEPNCDPPKEPISKLYFLKRNETCNSHIVNLQCGNDLQLCLPVVPGSDLGVGCAPDRPINGKGCPEWNNDNGCYVLNVRHNECETCSDYYLLSNSREVANCFKDKRATTTEQTTGTSAKGTCDKRSSLEHGDETTAGSPNKTSGKSEGNNEPEVGIIIPVVLSAAASIFIVTVAVIKFKLQN
ncbi:uncharacterized protein LOC134277860, partial [Saccostrea cucullata]|uniref:uncharacterized protein LOC134277860 n=1 Tax=Saccostrea cuccullata TaxID=36930 RepID=UPI002ED6BCDA